jgi:hypothetical protein
LWTGGGFIASTLALVLFVEVRHPEWFDREYQVRRTALTERVRKNPDRPVLLALGSSRMATGFMPERVEPLQDDAGREVLVFNFSRLGAGPRLTLVQLHRAFRDEVRPSWVIVEVSPALFAIDHLPAQETSWDEVRLLARYPEGRPRLYYQAVATRAALTYRVRTPLLEAIAPAFATHPEGDADPRVLPLGGADRWARKDHPTPKEVERFTEIAVKHHRRPMQEFHTRPAAIAAMRDLLAQCRDHGIRAVLLLPPESTEYRTWYGPGAEDEVQAILRQLRADFGVPVIDGRMWIADDGFSDPHHLNLRGAEQFTERLTAEVIRPLVAGDDR